MEAIIGLGLLLAAARWLSSGGAAAPAPGTATGGDAIFDAPGTGATRRRLLAISPGGPVGVPPVLNPNPAGPLQAGAYDIVLRPTIGFGPGTGPTAPAPAPAPAPTQTAPTQTAPAPAPAPNYFSPPTAPSFTDLPMPIVGSPIDSAPVVTTNDVSDPAAPAAPDFVPDTQTPAQI